MDEWQSDALVRPESCDSPSSPEPAAGLFGGACWEIVTPFQGWESFLWAPGAMPRSIILRLFEAGLWGEDGGNWKWKIVNSKRGLVGRGLGWWGQEPFGEERSSGARVRWITSPVACMIQSVMKQVVSVVLWERGAP